MSDVLQVRHEVLIRQLRPQAQHIEYLGAGDFNDVVRVDDEVFRFPKTDQGRQTLRYDEVILARLAGKVTLQIPEVHETADDGSYAVLSYVPGRMLSSEEIIAFTGDQKQQLAHAIADCMREINGALHVDEVRDIQRQYVPWLEDDDAHYKTILGNGTYSPYHELYEVYHQKLMQRRKDIGAPRQLVTYGDYHYGNMLFNDVHELTGLIDFSAMGPGTVINDLRQLYRLGQDIVGAVVKELDGELGEVDMEAVRLNAILHEVSVLMRPESQPPHVSPRAELARQLLNQWLGEGWDENL
ncbi:MAG: aminoglycoside phosphotransferase family protein [Candidatus Saccharimonadales bacterium]